MKKSTRRMLITLSLAMLLLVSSLSVAAAGTTKKWVHYLPTERNGGIVAMADCGNGADCKASLTRIDSISKKAWVVLLVHDYGRWIKVSADETYMTVGKGAITLSLKYGLHPGTELALKVGNDDFLDYEVYAAGTVTFP